MKKVRILLFLALLPLAATSGWAEEPSCEILGLLGMTPVTEASCAAIWVPVPEGKAIAGLRWYNNDNQVVFPRLLVASGEANAPVDASEALEVAAQVQGPAQGWAEVAFSEPYACESAGLYCLIMLPVGSEYTAAGTGGGAAFGYTADACGHQGWLGGAEGSWLKIAGAIGLAIKPVLVDSGPEMAVLKSMQGAVDPVGTAPMLLSARPNPFNPQTELQYSLPGAMTAELMIFDVRGKLVRRLVTGQQPGGLHTAIWRGEDDTGRRVASGVYLVRFRAGPVVQSQRLLLLK
jgi:hypothetical protein